MPFGAVNNKRDWIAAAVLATALAGCSENGGALKNHAWSKTAAGIETASVMRPSYTRPTHAVWDGDEGAYGMYGAHTTLPLGSWARVTNARTGQSAMIRINRRANASAGERVELSRDAAAAVGALHTNAATVLVEPASRLRPVGGEDLWAQSRQPARLIEPIETRPIAQAQARPEPQRAKPAPKPYQMAAAAPKPTAEWNPSLPTGSIQRPTQSAIDSRRAAPPPSGKYIQFGAFSDRRNAQRLIDRLQAEGMAEGAYGMAFVETAQVGGSTYHRVRIGPFTSDTNASRALRDAQALGHRGARIVRP